MKPQLKTLIFQNLFTIVLLAGCGASIPEIPVNGEFMGQTIVTTVDSEIAKYFLENYLYNQRVNPVFDGKIDQIYQRYQSPLRREDLKILSESCSVDFATLFFAKSLQKEEPNRTIQMFFEREVLERKEAIQQGKKQSIPNDSNYLVLFIPGWDYEENGHVTGADFAVPRTLISDLGIENYLIRINPIGSVEEDAEYLSKEIIRFSQYKKTIILVGASSAGPAIHLSLSTMLTQEQLRPVKAWLNLGGILQGSPLLDYLQKWPRSWLFQIVAWYKGWEMDKILSMSAMISRKRFEKLTMPEHVLVVNYVGLSLSGQLSKYSQDKYPILMSEGPNDGLTLLTDIIAPGSLTILALGSDHFFAEDPEINIKTIALAQTIIHYLETPQIK